MADCRHCKGTGKCDCHDCKVTYRTKIELAIKLKNTFGYDGYVEEKADLWASHNKVTVKCALCNGNGVIKGKESKKDIDDWEDLDD